MSSSKPSPFHNQTTNPCPPPRRNTIPPSLQTIPPTNTPHLRIQDHLLHTLHANNANWPTSIQSHALSLLRSGEVTSFPALLSRVMDDVRQDTALNPTSSTTNGHGAIEVNGSSKKANGVDSDKPNLALPQSVVDEALRVTREALDQVCGIDSEDT